MFAFTREATCSATSSGSAMPRSAALLLRIATRVSKTGGSTCATRPHSNRLTSRSCRFGISSGGLSDDSTICLCA